MSAIALFYEAIRVFRRRPDESVLLLLAAGMRTFSIAALWLVIFLSGWILCLVVGSALSFIGGMF